jgi:signal recognition particle receptor subunit beta
MSNLSTKELKVVVIGNQKSSKNSFIFALTALSNISKTNPVTHDNQKVSVTYQNQTVDLQFIDTDLSIEHNKERLIS